MIGLSTSPHSTPHQRRRLDDQLLYLMLKPSHAQALEIDRLRRTLGLDCRYAPGKFHITLQLFGDIRTIAASKLERICEAAASLHAEPFRVELSRVRGNALVGSDMRALHAFRRRLLRRLAAFGVALPDKKFEPHLSLQYGERQMRNTLTEPIGWLVDELLLINSIHGEGHEVVDRWPLLPRQGRFDF